MNISNLYTIYLGDKYICPSMGNSPFEAIERAKSKHWQYNCQTNISLWKAIPFKG